MNQIRQNFIYPKIEESHYRFGSNQFPADVLRPDGDWRPYLPPVELQKRNGVESSSCYIQAQQHTIATLQEEIFGLMNQNYSERFNALLSGGTEFGGDPLAGAESIRKNDGMIQDYLLPFSEDIKTWDDFHSFKGGIESECRNMGKQFLDKWKLNYDIVFTKGEGLVEKFAKLRTALKYSPCPISVYGQIDSNGNYVPKPEGASDTHLVEAIYVDNDDCIWIMDTYEPFVKKLPPKYNSDFCMRWSVSKLQTVKKKSLWQRLVDFFFRQKLIVRDFKVGLINSKYE